MRPVSSPRKLVTGVQAGLPGGGDTNDEAQSGGSYSGNKQTGGHAEGRGRPQTSSSS